MECWVTLYLGDPHLMCVDLESAITSDLFRRTAAANGISLQLSGIESHPSLGAVELYHALLRRAFSILRFRHPKMHPEVFLCLSLKGMN